VFNEVNPEKLLVCCLASSFRNS